MGKHIKTILEAPIKKEMEKNNCQECQTPCRSACKTSLTVSNLVCEIKHPIGKWTW